MPLNFIPPTIDPPHFKISIAGERDRIAPLIDGVAQIDRELPLGSAICGYYTSDVPGWDFVPLTAACSCATTCPWPPQRQLLAPPL